MNVELNFNGCEDVAKACATKTTEPNKALELMTTLVTLRAPSCTKRAKRGHSSA